jgi:hypothetical protein
MRQLATCYRTTGLHFIPVMYRMYLPVLLNSQTWPIGTQLRKFSLSFFEQADSGSATGSEKICPDPKPIILKSSALNRVGAATLPVYVTENKDGLFWKK